MPVSSGPEALNPQASVLAAALPRDDHDGGVTFRLKGVGSFLFLLWFQAPWDCGAVDVNTVEWAQPC